MHACGYVCVWYERECMHVSTCVCGTSVNACMWVRVCVWYERECMHVDTCACGRSVNVCMSIRVRVVRA